MTRSDELRQLGLAWNQAWNSRDVAELVRFFLPDSTFYEPNLAGPMAGADGVKASAVKTWSDWPGGVFDVVSLIVEDPRVVVEWQTRAIHRSGLEHLLEGVDILEFEGAGLRSCRIYYDTRSHKPGRRPSGVRAVAGMTR